jgi:hypothetical protein
LILATKECLSETDASVKHAVLLSEGTVDDKLLVEQIACNHQDGEIARVR